MRDVTLSVLFDPSTSSPVPAALAQAGQAIMAYSFATSFLRDALLLREVNVEGL